jgi:predicted neuraminidase
MIVPMYSDGYSYGIMGISDDGGDTWFASEPIIGGSGIQPSVVVKKDGTLVAFLRDNGPPPKRVQMTTSSDNGVSWSAAQDTETPNPGSSVEVIKLTSGEWVMAGNDTEKGRDRLRLALSDDEGATWKWSRSLENNPDGRFHYPSLIQAHDGSIHITYSQFLKTPDGEQKTIKHARLNVAWIKSSSN